MIAIRTYDLEDAKAALKQGKKVEVSIINQFNRIEGWREVDAIFDTYDPSRYRFWINGAIDETIIGYANNK